MIIQKPLMLVFTLLVIPLVYRAYLNEDRQWQIVSLSASTIILLLSVAAASPAVQTSSETVTSKQLIYLNDKSRSMIESGPNISMEGVSIDERTIASGNSSELEKNLLSAVETNKTYLVRSDLQGLKNPEKVINTYRKRNSKIYFLQQELPAETSLTLQGPSISVPGAQNRFRAELSSTAPGVQENVKVTVDGEEKISREVQGDFSFTHRFQEEGYHTLKAEISRDDPYSANNVFYRTVKVIEKPEILVLGSRGGLDRKLSEFYDVTVKSSLPQDLSQYYAVILKKKPENTAGLKPYLIDGNGLMYTGDGAMDILPVEKTSTTDETVNPSMVMALDVSKTEWSSEGTDNSIDIETSRSFGYSVVDSLNKDYPGTKLGLLAYSDGYFPLVQPGVLRDNSGKLLDSLRRLQLKGGDEYHQLGISKSVEMLNGEGNILLVTDGEIPGGGGVYGPVYRGQRYGDITPKEYKRKLLNYTETLPKSVKLFTVKVGGQNDGDVDFLRKLAVKGGGTSFESVDAFYENPPEDIGGGGYGQNKYLKVVDFSHDITSVFDKLNVAVSRFDSVRTRDSASKLVSTAGGRPFLSSWRYGLGRVASFSAGGKDLGQVISQEPGLVSRTASWTVGDPQRKENSSVEIESGRLGQVVKVSSDQMMEGLSRKPGGGYETRIRPETTGFHSFRDHVFSYNYREEIQNLGFRRQLMEDIADSTGGNVISEGELESLRSELSVSSREVTESKSLSWILLVLALFVFLFHVGYRKLNGLL